MPYFFLFCGLAGLYGIGNGLINQGRAVIEAIPLFSFCVALIGTSLPMVLSGHGSALDQLSEGASWPRYAYALASLGFAVTCGFMIFTSHAWMKQLLGIVGCLFFGLGVFVILFYDYKKAWKKMRGGNEF
jgi:hypothetical protein